MNKKYRVKQIIQVFDEIYKNAECTLDYNDPLELLISTQLAAQCTDARVNIVTASLFEKYKNVFYISGHMHSGISSTIADEKYGIHSAQQINGVTYISLPSFGLVNQYGITWFGTGAQLELYKDKVLYRPVNYLTGNWYTNAAYEFKLV